MKDTARAFRALADPTRRKILHILLEKEHTAGEIVSRFSVSGPSISRHLSILKAADLVSERREGNRIFYSLEPESIASCLGNFLNTVCPIRLIRKHWRRRSS